MWCINLKPSCVWDCASITRFVLKSCVWALDRSLTCVSHSHLGTARRCRRHFAHARTPEHACILQQCEHAMGNLHACASAWSFCCISNAVRRSAVALLDAGSVKCELSCSQGRGSADTMAVRGNVCHRVHNMQNPFCLLCTSRYR